MELLPYHFLFFSEPSGQPFFPTIVKKDRRPITIPSSPLSPVHRVRKCFFHFSFGRNVMRQKRIGDSVLALRR